MMVALLADLKKYLDTVKQTAARYILERSCPSGGFCFYRLDEPNSQDTYYALATLHLLQLPYRDERTIRYLHAIQQTDGTYTSLIQSFFVIPSLKYLGSAPLHDPIAGLEGLASRLLSGTVTSGETRPSLVQELYQLATLYEAMALNWQDGHREAILRLLHASRHLDGGYGAESSTLLATFHAAAALRRIGHPLIAATVEPFLRSCEHSVFGFTGKPATSLCFLEYVYAGLALCDEIALLPTYGEACVSFLSRCQTNSGGFARTKLAIASLENTYFAIHGLDVLTRLMRRG